MVLGELKTDLDPQWLPLRAFRVKAVRRHRTCASVIRDLVFNSDFCLPPPWGVWFSRSRKRWECSFLPNTLGDLCCRGPGSALERALPYSFWVLIKPLKRSWILVSQVKWHCFHSVEQSGSGSPPITLAQHKPGFWAIRTQAKFLLRRQAAIFTSPVVQITRGQLSASPIHLIKSLQRGEREEVSLLYLTVQRTLTNVQGALEKLCMCVFKIDLF